MQKFFLNEKIKIEALSRSANTALQKYNHKEYDTESMLTGLLTDCIGFYKNGGNTSREMEFLSLQAELNTAHRGINPRTLERVSIRRNEMKEIIMFKVLQSVSEIIRAELDGVTTVLNDTKISIIKKKSCTISNTATPP